MVDFEQPNVSWAVESDDLCLFGDQYACFGVQNMCPEMLLVEKRVSLLLYLKYILVNLMHFSSS